MVDQFCHLTVLGREGYLEVISFQCDRFIIPVCCQRTVGGLNLSGDLSRGEYPLLNGHFMSFRYQRSFMLGECAQSQEVFLTVGRQCFQG